MLSHHPIRNLREALLTYQWTMGVFFGMISISRMLFGCGNSERINEEKKERKCRCCAIIIIIIIKGAGRAVVRKLRMIF
jgi:hypothetical protein